MSKYHPTRDGGMEGENAQLFECTNAAIAANFVSPYESCSSTCLILSYNLKMLPKPKLKAKMCLRFQHFSRLSLNQLIVELTWLSKFFGVCLGFSSWRRESGLIHRGCPTEVLDNLPSNLTITWFMENTFAIRGSPVYLVSPSEFGSGLFMNVNQLLRLW